MGQTKGPISGNYSVLAALVLIVGSYPHKMTDFSILKVGNEQYDQVD